MCVIICMDSYYGICMPLPASITCCMPGRFVNCGAFKNIFSTLATAKKQFQRSLISQRREKAFLLFIIFLFCNWWKRKNQYTMKNESNGRKAFKVLWQQEMQKRTISNKWKFVLFCVNHREERAFDSKSQQIEPKYIRNDSTEGK